MNRNEEVEAWYKAHADKIKKWSSGRSKQDAEDILQNMAIRLLKDSGKWEEISFKRVMRFAQWEYYKGGENRYKGKRGVKFKELEEQDHDATNPEELLHRLHAKRSVKVMQELAETLGGASRQIFEMHFFLEMGYEEISKKLGMPHGSVKQLGSRANKIVVEKFKRIVE